MNKPVFCLVVFFCLAALCCSCKEKYEQARRIFNKLITINETFIKEFNAADKKKDAKGVAKALVSYKSRIDEINPQLKDIQEKYPELASNPPDEIKDITRKLQKTMSDFMTMSVNLRKYGDDPDAMEIINKLME